jgi:NTP pyrophosphatase (non-canonical NTP hydrolase)
MNISDLVKEAHESAKAHGWWDEPKTFGEMIALIHSEASEALEEFRNGHDPKETYGVSFRMITLVDKPEGIPSELADIIIRVADMCGYYGIDLEKAVKDKMHYNKSRPYKHGGKKI